MEIIYKDVQSLKGIGEAKAKLLRKLGVKVLEDLLYLYPRGYKDKSIIANIADLQAENSYTLRVIIETKPQEQRVKNGIILTKCRASDSTGKINIVWFNNRYIKNSINCGEEYFLHGKVKQAGRDKVMESPEFEKVTDKESVNINRIVPYYPLTEGLTQKEMRKAVKSVVEAVHNKMADVFPEDFRRQYNMAEINFCLNNIHFPESMYNLQLAIRRFKFEELFMLQSGLIHIKRMNHESKKGIVFGHSQKVMKFVDTLPFKLTNAQLRVLAEIFEDMDKENIMNRLVQGDVGSGKTIIAFLALYKCCLSGYQGILMAPTEILAEQHYLSFSQLMGSTGIRIRLLTGSLTPKEKRALLENIKNGEVDVVVGTHALIQENVEFERLGLVITDEQHRFGVRQRAVLSGKGNNPDIIVMTATPIPRTLSLILYGDLDISVIDEMPPGRKKVDTYFIDSGKKERLFNFIKKELDQGRQAYVVCPLVEESEKLDLNSAVEYSELLQSEYFKGYRVGLLHGKMKSEEKNKIMESFRINEINILVSTTVIEVGVNIPNATIMVVENAERFGLAQLHQLRGRVGRGSSQSYCILISDSDNATAIERLKYMTKTENGFDIAEKDLELRGGGEILGQRQHGLPELKIADIIKDVELLKLSRKAVEYLYDSNKLVEPEYARMKKILDQRFNRVMEEITLN
ncbi:MAG: ATP-dependent DNA helicase RecG [Bacillota bacterium]